MRSVALITTGGTIEKTYDEASGVLDNRRSIVHRMLRRLRLEGTTVNVVELMHKDSQHMTDADRERIAEAVRAMAGVAGGDDRIIDDSLAGVVVSHGTDTLELTGEHLHAAFPRPSVPIVLTAAMRPFEMKQSDALQNLTEAIFAARTLQPGVYCVAHGRALTFPGVRKDRDRGTFVKSEAPGH